MFSLSHVSVPQARGAEYEEHVLTNFSYLQT